MLKVAIVGCGKIADQHLLAIRRIPGSVVTAVCDREILMARQLGERFQVHECYDDLKAMLEVAAPDVVHVTTPPQTHFGLAKQCLDAGSHVYLEKPLTITALEAVRLVELATSTGLSLTAGHNYQFTPEMMSLRRLVKDGFIGARPVHLESYWSYDLNDVSYVGPLLGDPNHWVRKLPGQLFHNLISHGVARLAEFLDDDIVELIALAHQSPRLNTLGGGEVRDELRVLIRDGRGTTATFCFTTQIKPSMNRLRVFGEKNSITVDLTSGSLLKHQARSDKSYLTFVLPPLRAARAHWTNFRRNALAIAGGRLHYDSGMKELIERFHISVSKGAELPIPYREILLTARLMDGIFAAIGTAGGAQGGLTVPHARNAVELELGR